MRQVPLGHHILTRTLSQLEMSLVDFSKHNFLSNLIDQHQKKEDPMYK